MSQLPRRPLLLSGLALAVAGCSVFRQTYRAAGGVVQGTVWIAKTTSVVTAGTVKTVYRIGEFSYEKGYQEEGIASWYGYESGRMTANGEAFDPDGLTAAHKYLPMGFQAQGTARVRVEAIEVREEG